MKTSKTTYHVKSSNLPAGVSSAKSNFSENKTTNEEIDLDDEWEELTPVISIAPGLALESIDPEILKTIHKMAEADNDRRWVLKLKNFANCLEMVAKNSSDSAMQLFAASMIRQFIADNVT